MSKTCLVYTLVGENTTVILESDNCMEGPPILPWILSKGFREDHRFEEILKLIGMGQR